MTMLRRSVSNPPPAQQPSRNLTDAEAARWRAQMIDEAKAAARVIVQQEIAALRDFYERGEEGNEGLLVGMLASVFNRTEDLINAKFAQLPPGPPGPMGKLTIVNAYVPERVHYAGDVVTHQGGTWQARFDTVHAPPHSDWICLAAAGIDAPMPTIRGTYDVEARYRHLDIVAQGGSSFMARKDEPGVCPGPDWQLIASAGRPGRTGPIGRTGERGEKGDKGDPGPVILDWEIDRASYQAVPIMSDGTLGPPLALRALFEQFHSEASI